jgi:hypothetical protein
LQTYCGLDKKTGDDVADWLYRNGRLYAKDPEKFMNKFKAKFPNVQLNKEDLEKALKAIK